MCSDIDSLDVAAEAVRRSAADGAMIGRGACGRPWFPKQVGHFLRTRERLPDPPLVRQLALLLEHFEDMLGHYGRELAVRMARKHIGWYTKGLPRSAAFRQSFNRIGESDAARRAILAFYRPLIEREAA